MTEKVSKKLNLDYCPYCGAILSSDILNLIKKGHKPVYCEFCGAEIKKRKYFNFYNSDNQSKEEIIDPNRFRITNYNPVSNPQSEIAFDIEFSKIFRENMIIVLSRLIYFYISKLYKIEKLKNCKKEITESLLDEIAGNLISIVNKRIKINFLGNLHNISIRNFEKLLKKLQDKIKSNQSYYNNFIIYLRWLIFTVFKLISEMWDNNNIPKFEETILKDLKSYGFDIYNKKINKRDSIEILKADKELIVDNNIDNKLLNEKKPHQSLYRDLEKLSWEFWFNTPWSEYQNSHILLKDYWRRRLNKISKIVIRYCQKYDNIPFKAYILRNGETEWKELKGLRDLKGIDKNSINFTLLNKFNIDLSKDILNIQLLYKKYQYKHLISTTVYSTKKLLNDLFDEINKLINKDLIKSTVEIILNNKKKNVNIIYGKKITQYALSLLMGQDRQYIGRVVKQNLRNNKYYIIDFDVLQILLKNILLIFKNYDNKLSEIAILKLKTVISDYMKINKKFFLAKKFHVLQYHPNIILDYFNKLFDDSHDLIERIEVGYWLGFIFADGYITRENEFGINIAIKDKSMLYKFCLAIGGNPTYIRDVITDTKKGKNYKASVFRIYNAKFCKFLRNYGVIKQKSTILSLPLDFLNMEENDNVMKQIFMAFLLGYYDGDGTENKGKINSGSKKFLEQIKFVIQKIFKIDSKSEVKEESRNGKKSYYYFIKNTFKKKMEENFKGSMARKRKYIKGNYDDDIINTHIFNLLCNYLNYVFIDDIKEIYNDVLEKNEVPKVLRLSEAKIKRLCVLNNISVHKLDWYKKRNLNLDEHKKSFKKKLQAIF